MSNAEHHRALLIETALSELDRTHRGVLAMDASEVRRGLQLALTALHNASEQGAAAGAVPTDVLVRETARQLTKALADLDNGSLAEMDTLIETARKGLAGAT